MKLKFFSIVFGVLLLTTLSVSALHFYFLQNERLRLIDRQIETSASIVISSDLSKLPLDDIEEVEDYFHGLLKSEKINKIIIIRNKKGRVIYSSRNAEWILQDPPEGPRWQTIQAQGHYIRLLSIDVPQISKTLQIGAVLDSELFQWRQLDVRFLLYSAMIIVLVLLVSYLLTNVLLKPLRNLAVYLNHLAQQCEAGVVLDRLDQRRTGLSTKGGDEFAELLRAVLKLRNIIAINLVAFKNWTAQMAHELKTPLTILRNGLESYFIGSAKSPRQIGDLMKESLGEVDRIDNMINRFLEWAAIESSPDPGDLRAIQLASLVTQLCERLKVAHGNRVDVQIHAKPVVFAAEEYLEQAIANLIVNALKYSPPESKVTVSVQENQISIIDHGPGIPEAVISKLGKPFNFYQRDTDAKKGTGLGLAWTVSICRKYGWELVIEPAAPGPGTSVSIKGFNKE